MNSYADIYGTTSTIMNSYVNYMGSVVSYIEIWNYFAQYETYFDIWNHTAQ